MRRCLGCMREYDEQFDMCPHCGYVHGSPAANKSHLPPGTVLQNRYLLGKVLGQGGFGITYIAWDQRLQKAVAVKEFFPTAFAARMTGQNEVSCFNAESHQYFVSGLQKMMTESRLLAQFTDQTNIVQVLDCFEENGTAYIIMELLRGETVQSILKREGQLSLTYTLRIILPILQALQTVHKTGLVHRDISPDNIFVCEDGKVKLLDFGAARIATGQDHKTLSVMLKKGYAPIEQYSSHGVQGTFTDVYAVCATMYKMLTGVTPDNSLDRMTEDRLRPISDFADVPDAVAKVIRHGMAIDASFRIRTAGELYERLQRAVQSGTRTASAAEKPPKQPKPLKQSKQPKPPKQPKASAQKPKEQPARKGARTALLATAACLVVAAVVCGVIFGKHLFGGKSLDHHIEVGDTVSFGSYGMDGESAKAIDWIVLERNGDEALLLSEKGLDYQTYHITSGTSFTWETAWIREWLNTDFYDAAFSDEEKAQIVLHENENPDNPIYGTSGGNNTLDRCFLLSMQEVEQYFPVPDARKANATESVVKYNKEYSDYANTGKGHVWWMLRSSGDDSGAASENTTFLSVSPAGTYDPKADGFQYCVIRPAIWVNVNGSSGDADTEWVSGYREHLYDFSYELRDGVLRLTGEGDMPQLYNYVWSAESCESVRSVVIGDGFTSVSPGAFMDCVNLTSVQIPQSVQEIGWSAFRNCPKLTTISLPSSVTRIGSSAFHESGVASNKAYWKDGLMCLGHCLIRASKSVKGCVVVPDTVTVIAESAFRGRDMTEVSVPQGVTQLEDTFSYCKQLRSVCLPDGVQTMNYTFYGCEALRDVRLPEGLQRIESGFYDCESLQELVLPQSLQYIDEQAFACCWSLKNVTLYAEIGRIPDSAFFNCPSIETVSFYGSQADWDSLQIEDGNEQLTDAALELKTQTDSPFSGLQKGDTVTFGTYEQNGSTQDGAEPIRWIVADTADGGQSLLLVSESVLDCRAYHTEYVDVTWTGCEMREWLRDTFYEQSFTPEEKARIRLVPQDNPDNKTYQTRGGGKTIDTVFLLSLQQAHALGSVHTAARPTEYAVAQGAFLNEENGCTWWSLRTPGSGNDLNAVVRSDGEVRAGGEKVTAMGGVRPAIWVSAS